MKKATNKIFNQLINPKEISFEEVKKQFKKENKILKGSNVWVYRIIKKTNKKLPVWFKAEIPKNLLLKIVLPWHHHRGKIELIPKKGITVKEACKRFKKTEIQYKKTNKKCWKTIKHFKNKKNGFVFLSSEIPNKKVAEYKLIKPRKDQPINLDGLHRMMALAYKIKKYKPINCIIAFQKQFKCTSPF